jgi:hypothetical protein
MTDYKKIIETWAYDPYVTHDDVTKCGQCLREQIKSDLSKKLLKSGSPIGEAQFRAIIDLSRDIWKDTPLYRRVKDLLDGGMTLEEIDKKLREEGIEI